MVKTDFKSLAEVLTWRKDLLNDVLINLDTRNKKHREYVTRIKELDWIIGKLNQINEMAQGKK